MDWDPQPADARGYICPPCPEFHPTPDEFRDPLKYISSIRHVGMLAGICKIVPPPGWRPPFAVNERGFRFRTRVQQLNCIDAHSRAEKLFLDELRMFLYRRATPMRGLPRVDGQLVNLRLLFQAVTALGGYRQVSTASQWPAIVRRVGRTRAAGQPTAELCDAYRQHYEDLLLAFEDDQRGQVTPPGAEVKAAKQEVAADGTAPDNSLNVAETPAPKSRSSMKKTRRRSSTIDEEPVDGDVGVKRTLFDGSHSGSDDAHSPQKTDKTSGGSQEKRAKRESTALASASSAGPVALEPASLKPSPKRSRRLDPPEIVVGQRFFRFFPETGAIVAEVRRVLGGKKPHATIRYVDDGAVDDVELSTLQILVANGWNPAAAELAFKSEICQACLRGDCSDKMLLCDGCDAGHHLFCLDPPLSVVPEGDWYCQACVDQAAHEATDAKAARERATFGFEMGAETSLTAFKAKADAWKREYFGSLPSEPNELEVEQEYWRILGTPAHEQRLEVEYGSDVDSGAVGSGFPRSDTIQKSLRFMEQRWKKTAAHSEGKSEDEEDELLFAHGLREPLEAGESLEQLVARYAGDGWNLNNLPKLPGSVLQHLDEDIKGVMVPWIYMGMCFSTFCWHVEDHNFYSISYLHCGAPKTWYGVPSAQADAFEATMRKLTPELFGKQPDLHLQMVTMFSPKTLREHGVSVYRASQRANEFIVTFPSAYHGGFNNGFNCAEAVNFSTVDWLPWGRKSVDSYRRYRKLPVFCHDALVCSLSETIADDNSVAFNTQAETFDAEAARKFLLPAMEQLRDEFARFEALVAASPVTRRGSMREYEQYLEHGSGLSTADGTSGSRLAAATRRSMASRMSSRAASDACDQDGGDSGDDRAVEAGGMKRRRLTTKARMTPTRTPGSARPSRMVLWAGQSGRHEGLRCAACKQYCYLQAVACTRCALRQPTEAHRTVACAEHVAGMCRCDPDKHYTYLSRYSLADLDALLDRMRAKLRRVDDWSATVDSIVGSDVKEEVEAMETDEGKTNSDKRAVEELETLLATGKQLGGVAPARLDALQRAIDTGNAWTNRADAAWSASPDQQAVHSHSASWTELCALLTAAEELKAVPRGMHRVQQLAASWSDCEPVVQRVLTRVASIQREESADVSTFRLDTNSDARSVVVALDAENEALGDVMDELADARARVSSVPVDVAKRAAADLDRATAYLEVLSGANAMTAAAACRLSSANNSVRVGEAECRALVEEAAGLGLARSLSIRKVELLRSLLRASQPGADELAAALQAGRVSSAEELAALLERAQRLPILPAAADEVAARLHQCRKWETRAAELLRNGSVGHAAKPPLADVEAFGRAADAHLVPASSLLRRQLHARVQDARRWQQSVVSLFLRPSGSRMALDAFFSRALARLQADPSTTSSDATGGVFRRWRAHCVCEQVLNDRAAVISCRQCARLFHPACVGLAQQQSFTCSPCRLGDRTAASPPPFVAPPDVFCSCRGPELLPMVCCDFCDEWYHGACVGLSEDAMARVEAFRCPRCAVRERVAYLDATLTSAASTPPLSQGRRPALARVRALLSQLRTQLVAEPAGAQALVEYVEAVERVENEARAFAKQFTRAFSPAAFAQMDAAAEQQRVAAMLERLAALEVAPGTGKSDEDAEGEEEEEARASGGRREAEDDVEASLRAIHWCLRACALVLGSDHAPKYSHLVVLLEDARRIQQPPRGSHQHQSAASAASSSSSSSAGLAAELPPALRPPFTPNEYARIQQTVTELVARAERWLRQVKLLEVEEWNVGRARRLRAEYAELVQFLELPAAEVKLVHDIAGGGDGGGVATAYNAS